MKWSRFGFRGEVSAWLRKAIFESHTGGAGAAGIPALRQSWKTSFTRLWRKDRELRYQSAAEMRSDLKRLSARYGLRNVRPP